MSDVVWSDPGWLQIFPLNAFTVLDYFARSPFYDATCNNEILRSQGQDLSRLPTLAPGIEYVIHDTQEPHLFIIRTQRRDTPKAVVAKAFHYILDGRVYQSPPLHSVIVSRLNRCVFNVRAAFGTIKDDINPLLRVEKEVDAKKAQATVVPLSRSRAADREHARQIDGVLQNILGTLLKGLAMHPRNPGYTDSRIDATSAGEGRRYARAGEAFPDIHTSKRPAADPGSV